MVQAYCKQDIYVVHRLDRPVSGVVIFAKNKSAAADLGNQFAEGTARKSYLALVTPGITPEKGTLSHSLVRTTGKTRLAKEGEQGQECVLEYSLIRKLDNYDLLEIRPVTGRTHQIRAQLSLVGHPVKGDVKYGARRGNRDRSINLHCKSIQILHPAQKGNLSFDSPVPDDPIWQAAVQQ